ncbi:NADH:ubiquinone reductase (Na(+)-transporting) subunit D [Desulfoluna spongiiphila]|uniref:Na+-transporting NADH:ubiquinone oxidoreductase subunit D n=1 Tax=Desulfoluna spongiiphila TaxID=419481 RepID=A0A1G5GBB5_9BACT|nr:NADH:ubiquinone reductase (Na(+)-transporting) subunit D [Desulfoluna spongiiphila]SCY48641.1 Na+-transporting NADH:ubiquinone oxidoreductase subunit D [Desulfoluna spongiiphila]VVS93672.1 nqrde/rnfae [Desulfoluna spongiiphila]
MGFTRTRLFRTFKAALWEDNPISRQILGICSALAVTVQMKTALVMALALTAVLTFSNLIISILRNQIPRNIRMIVELTVIASLVVVADEILKAYLYDISKQLSIFVGLIITNCIIMGRAESFAMANPPPLAVADGLGNGLGYALVLVGVAFLREFLGAGKIFGVSVVPQALYDAGFMNMGLMTLAPGAFIVIGLLVWIQGGMPEEED